MWETRNKKLYQKYEKKKNTWSHYDTTLNSLEILIIFHLFTYVL